MEELTNEILLAALQFRIDDIHLCIVFIYEMESNYPY